MFIEITKIIRSILNVQLVEIQPNVINKLWINEKKNYNGKPKDYCQKTSENNFDLHSFSIEICNNRLTTKNYQNITDTHS